MKILHLKKGYIKKQKQQNEIQKFSKIITKQIFIENQVYTDYVEEKEDNT